MKQRNGQPNARYPGEKLSVSLSVPLESITSKTLADPQFAKQTNMTLINETKKWIIKCKISRAEAERITQLITRN